MSSYQLWQVTVWLVVAANLLAWDSQVSAQIRNNIGAYPGQRVKLTCNVTGTSVPAEVKFQWEKPEGTVIGQGETFVIPSITVADAGVYVCRALSTVNGKVVTNLRSSQVFIRDAVGSNEDAPIPVAAIEDDVELILSPEIPASGRRELTLGESFYQACQARYRDNRPTASNQFSITWLNPQDEKISTTNFIYIPQVSREHAGSYTCVAENSRTGREVRKQFFIQIASGGTADYDPRYGGQGVERDDQRGGAGRNDNSDPYYGRREESLPEYDPYSEGGNQGGRSETDYYESGGGGGGSSGRVDSARDASQARLRIVQDPFRPVLRERLTMTCSVEPESLSRQANFEWFVDGRPVERGPVYEIPQFENRNYRQTIECRADIQGRSIMEKASNQLDFSFGTELKMQSSPGYTVMVRVNQRKEIHCEIARNAQRLTGRDAVWTFNGRPINADGREFARVDTMMVSVLTLLRTSVQNEGLYSCRVGNTVNQVNLIVGSDISQLEVSPPSQEVDAGQAIEIHCRATNLEGITNNQLTWFFLGDRRDGRQQPLRAEWRQDRPIATSETFFITLEQATPADSGFYMCQANSGQSEVAEVMVKGDGRSGSQGAIVRIQVSPRNPRVQPNSPASLQCTAYDETDRPTGTPMWRRRDGSPLDRDPRFAVSQVSEGVSRLQVYSLGLQDSGMEVECYDPSNPSITDSTVLLVEDSSQSDCDPLDLQCEIHNGVPPSKSVFSANWKCDGETDCGNGFDEANCPSTQSACGGTHYQCRGSETRIPMAFRCDKEFDCPQRDDEDDCRPPTITREPQMMSRLRSGDTVTLTCAASGTPAPRIVWRLNWRCLPNSGRGAAPGDRGPVSRRTDGRFRETSSPQGCDSVSSTLEISGLMAGDDGIYNCEAVSNNGRALSKDAQLILT